MLIYVHEKICKRVYVDMALTPQPATNNDWWLLPLSYCWLKYMHHLIATNDVGRANHHCVVLGPKDMCRLQPLMRRVEVERVDRLHLLLK